jgi:NAD(P)-dependent dehydrogenase (short-subunit alcohol dehydrogenase family)
MTGVFLLTQSALPTMKKNRSGRIINVGSVTGKRPLPGRGPYAAAKMALIGFTRTLAFEVGEYGITANVICLGPTEGPRIKRVCEEMALSGNISFAAATFTAPAALKRFVRPEDHAAICVFLASDDGANITGQDINVSGGLVWY